MNDVSQVAVLLVCLTAGLATGLLFEFVSPIRMLHKSSWCAAVADLLFFVLFFGVLLLFRVLFFLPDVRAYMLLGALTGFLLYYESVHRILAFLTRKLYNTYRNGSWRFPILRRRPKVTHGRKKKADNHRRYGGSGRVARALAHLLGVSGDRRFGKKEPRGRIE